MNPKKTTKLGNALHKAKEEPVAEVAALEEQPQENQKYPLAPSPPGNPNNSWSF
jgi:hypothetical protein